MKDFIDWLVSILKGKRKQPPVVSLPLPDEPEPQLKTDKQPQQKPTAKKPQPTPAPQPKPQQQPQQGEPEAGQEGQQGNDQQDQQDGQGADGEQQQQDQKGQPSPSAKGQKGQQQESADDQAGDGDDSADADDAQQQPSQKGKPSPSQKNQKGQPQKDAADQGAGEDAADAAGSDKGQKQDSPEKADSKGQGEEKSDNDDSDGSSGGNKADDENKADPKGGKSQGEDDDVTADNDNEAAGEDADDGVTVDSTEGTKGSLRPRQGTPKANKESDIDLTRNANADWRNLEARLKELKGIIGRVEMAFMDIMNKYSFTRYSTRRHKDEGSFSDIDKKRLIKGQIQRRSGRAPDPNIYRDVEKGERDANVFAYLLIDGSNSMLDLQRSGTTNMRSAIQSAAILRAGGAAANIHASALVWGARDKKQVAILARPDMNDSEVARNFAVAQKGQDWGTDLTPGIVRAVEDMVENESVRADAKCGGTHLVIISDGDVKDPERVLEVLRIVRDEAPSVTVSFAMLHDTENTQLHQLVNRFNRESPAERQSMVFTSLDAQKIPMGIMGVLQQKMDNDDAPLQSAAMRQSELEGLLVSLNRVRPRSFYGVTQGLRPVA